jgi:hypothetical protein
VTTQPHHPARSPIRTQEGCATQPSNEAADSNGRGLPNPATHQGRRTQRARARLTQPPTRPPNGMGEGLPGSPPEPPERNRKGLPYSAIHPSRRNPTQEGQPDSTIRPTDRNWNLAVTPINRTAGSPEERGTTRSEGLLASSSCSSPILAARAVGGAGSRVDAPQGGHRRRRRDEGAP